MDHLRTFNWNWPQTSSIICSGIPQLQIDTFVRSLPLMVVFQQFLSDIMENTTSYSIVQNLKKISIREEKSLFHHSNLKINMFSWQQSIQNTNHQCYGREMKISSHNLRALLIPCDYSCLWQQSSLWQASPWQLSKLLLHVDTAQLFLDSK